MLQVPAVHVVEGVHVQVVAAYETHRADRCEARAEQEYVPGCDLACKASDEAALELFVVSLGIPRSSITGADQRDPVSQEHIGICT